MPLLTSVPRLSPLLLLVSAAALTLAYVYTLLTRPSPPDWKREEDPSKYGFPAWFSTRYMPTPYEETRTTFSGQPEEVLLFIDLPRDSALLPHAFYLHDLLKNRADVSMAVIAPWMEEWDSGKSAGDNLEAAGCRKRVWRYGEGEGDFGGACQGSTIINEQASHSKVAPKINARADITILPEPRYLLAKDNSYSALAESLGKDWKMGVLAHILPMANPALYYPRSEGHASYRTVSYYPRRDTPPAKRPAMRGSKQYTIFKAPYPTVLPSKAYGVEPDVFSPRSSLRRFWDDYEEKLAEHMRAAGICVFEGWQNGELDDRVAAAMLGGCIVATVAPDVEHAALERLVVPLNRTEDALPSQQIESVLGGKTRSELAKMALDAFVFARNEFTGDIKVDSVLDIVHKYDHGARGYMFPHGFRWTCNSAGDKPSWCPAE